MAINELECTHCGGTGYHGETKCPKCDGTGKITGWNAVSPTSLEYNSSGFMDELTNPEKEPLEFYAGGMVQGGDPRGHSPDQSDVKATGHQKYVDMAEQDYDAGGGLFSQQDYENEYAKGKMREAQDDDKSDYDLDQELKHYQVTPFRNKSKKKMREEVLKANDDGSPEHKKIIDQFVNVRQNLWQDTFSGGDDSNPFNELNASLNQAYKDNEDLNDYVVQSLKGLDKAIEHEIEEEFPQQEMPNQVEEISEEEETLQSLKTQYTIDTLKGDIKNLKLEQDKQDARIIMDELVQEEILPVIDQLKADIVQGLQTPNEGNDEIKAMQEESHMCNDCMGKAYASLEVDCPDCDMDLSTQDRLERHQDKAHSNQPSNTWTKNNTWNQYRDKQMKKEDKGEMLQAEELDLVDITTGDIDIENQLRRLKKYFKDIDQKLSPSPYEVEDGLTHEDIEKLSDEQDGSGLLTNEVAKRTDPDEFVCPKCDYKTNIKEEFEDHKITHDDYYMRQDESISHLQEVHHMCGGCNKDFLSSAEEMDFSGVKQKLIHFDQRLINDSANKTHADIINKGKIIGANCNICGMHFEGNLWDESDWTTQHSQETGHGEFSIFFLRDESGKSGKSREEWDLTVKGVGESSITPEYKWELIDNEWIPIGRTVKAKSKIKRKNIFVGDMIEAD